MCKEEFTYKSNDNKTDIHVIKWIPKNEPIAILQIAHGMVEFIERYDDFAKFLNKNNILVVGNDHLGHGDSVVKKDDWGYFSHPSGRQVVLDDMKKLHDIIKKEYPSCPYFLLGHSMGSFFARRYLIEYGNTVDGVIISGTGGQSLFEANMGKWLTAVIAKFKGWRFRSDFIDNLAFGGMNKKIKTPKTSKDWLSRDEKIVKKYIEDERNNFKFTLNAYNGLFYTIGKTRKKSELRKTPKDIPVLFISGKEDPVGNFGKGVKKVVSVYKSIGMNKVESKLYTDYRHEILNEIGKEKVYNDILNWIIRNIKY